MGYGYSLTCGNKECHYSITLREGPGMYGFARKEKIKEKIMSGEIEVSEEIINLLKEGYRLDCTSNYLCSVCKEWQVKDDCYIFEPIHISPYGTIREYNIYYPFGNPKCDKCGSDLEYLFRPRSSKNKCPKCGSEMKYKGTRFYYD